jgi:hypothetical protein
MGDRQLDIPATNSKWFVLPRNLPMRLNGQDFVNFIWFKNIDPSRYTIVVESLDTAGPPFRGISKLQKRVELPLVQFGWDAKIGVIPDVDTLPSFEAKLVRGSTYLIPDVRKNGIYMMDRFGADRPPGM